jgi:chaperonin GroES
MSGNTSGLQPVEYKILIEPEEVEQKSAGGIVLATSTTEKEKMAQVRGRLIAVGGNAFEDWKQPIPKVGDTVLFAKYAGLVVKAKDGRELRVTNDKDLTAVVTDQKE